MAPNEDMIAYRSSARIRSCANGAHMVERAVGPDPSGTMHSDRTAVRDDETWSYFSIGVNVDECHNYKQLTDDAERHPCGRPKPSGSSLRYYPLKPIQTKRPEALRSPAGEP